MERGASEAFIGASRGLGVQRISLSARAMAPVVAGARVRALSERNERRLETMGGPHASAAAAGSERRRSGDSCVGRWPSWRWPGRPLAALALRLAHGLAGLWLGRLASACVRVSFFYKTKL